MWGKNFSVVLLHFVIVGFVSEEHSKHTFQAFSLFYEENKTLDIAPLYVCLFMLTLSQS